MEMLGFKRFYYTFFMSKAKNIFIFTDKRMIRFMMTLDNAVRLVWKSIEDMKGEMYEEAPSMKVIDIIHSFSKAKIQLIELDQRKNT